MNFVRIIIIIFSIIIVITTRDEILNQIKEKCNLLYTEKIKMMNLFENIYSNDIQKKKLILIPSEETSKYFSACYLGIKDFLTLLRNYPEIMYKLIKYSDKKYFTYHFNFFLLNNFYEDILNQNFLSKEFIYIVKHLFEDIISKLDSPSDFIKTYEDSNLSCLLNGLVYKREIQIYFNSILGNIIDDYTNSSKGSKVLLFDVSELNNFIKNRDINYHHLIRNSDLNKKKQIEKKKKEQLNAVNNIFRMRFNSVENTSITESLNDLEEEVLLAQNSVENEEFVTKYLQDLNKEDLEKLISNKDNKDNKYLKEYIQYQLSYIGNNHNFFSNSNLLEKIQKSKESEKILFYYERNFMICINILNQILEQIKINICIMPSIIRAIFKILADLLKNKFPHIKNIELYINLSAIIIKIIHNCFSNQEYNCLLSTILFNSRIKRNLNIIMLVFCQFISFGFYNSEDKSDYTPFNLYFLDKFKIIFNIYDKILDFNMADNSSNRKKSIKFFHFHSNKNVNIDNNNLNNNKEKLFYSIAICYNVEDITTLLNIIKHNINYILEEKTTLYPVDEFKKIYEKLRDNKEIFKSLKERDISTINYYILFEIIFSNSFNDLIGNKKLTPIFRLEKIEKKNNSKKDNRKNDLISTENLMSELLMNLPELDSIGLKINNSNNTKQIMNDLSLYINSKHNIMDNFNDNSSTTDNDHYQKMKIPLEWYINSLSKSMEKMDDKYKKKEYEKFFIKFKKNIENSIEGYGFDYIGQLSESLNYISNLKEECIEIQNIFEEINLNTQIIEFINTEIIEIEMKFKYDKNEKYFEINKKKKNHENDLNLICDNNKICYNIPEFIQNFPDLISTQKYYNNNLFDIEKEINLNENLNLYFDIITEKISKKFLEDKKENILLKIKKYIFEKIYNKTFPNFPQQEDQTLFMKTGSLVWIKPENLNLNNFDFDSLIPLTTEYFIQINKQRSPLGKLYIINKLFEIIFNALKYIKGEHFSNLDILNITDYIIIKAKPEKFCSNLKYLDIFENKEFFDNNKIYIKILRESVENLLKANHKTFKGISEADFNKNVKIK